MLSALFTVRTRVSRNTAPRALHPNTCLALNKQETLNTSNGANWWRGETSSYPEFASTSSVVRWFIKQYAFFVMTDSGKTLRAQESISVW